MTDDNDDGYYLKEEEIPPWFQYTTVQRLEVADGEKMLLQCNGCNHVWDNRVEEPHKCPNGDCSAKIDWDESGDVQEVENETNLEDLIGG